MRLLAAASLLLASCGDPAPAYDPLDYLSIGVDPTAEATREERALEAHGFAITARVDGRTFVALGAIAPARRASAVRILSSQGIAMGIDAPVRDRPTWRSVTLIESPSGRDLDGDGEAEVLVRVDDTRRPAPCIVVVRVRRIGDAFEVPIDARAYGARACPEEIGDVEGDGRFELFVGHRPWVVRDAPTPVIPIPFQGQDGAWVACSDATLAALAPHAIAERIEASLHARERGEVRELVRLSLEIAWFRSLGGGEATTRLAELDEALAGLVLDEPTTRLVEQARASIAAR